MTAATASSLGGAVSTEAGVSEFKTGWRVLLAALVGIVTSAGVMPLYTFPLFVKPLSDAMGWTRGQLQITITFFFVGLVVGSQISAVAIRRFGLRPVALVSLVAYAATYAALSRVGGSIWTLYIGYLLLVVFGTGTLQITWTQLVNLWFDRNRGLALAIALTGTGVCSLVVVPYVTAIMTRQGWSAAFLGLAAIPLVVMLPVTWLCVPGGSRPAQPPPSTLADHGLFLGQAMRGYRFWVMAVAFVLVVSGVLGVLTNSVALMRDRGISPAAAAGVVAVSGASLILGRLGVGWLLDRLWAPGVAFVTLLVPAFGCLLFGVSGADLRWLMTGSALVGLGAGAEYDVSAYLVARYFGMIDYSRVYGSQFALTSAGVCVAPMLFAALIDRTGSYDALLWCCGVGFAVGSSMLLTLGAYPRFGAASARGAGATAGCADDHSSDGAVENSSRIQGNL